MLGFTQVELARIVRFLLVGVIMAYATLMNVLGRSASGAARAGQSLKARKAERRAIRRKRPKSAPQRSQPSAR